MPLQNCHYIPLATAFLFPVTFITTYAIAVSSGHADSFWPYISDTGTIPPESCIFGQFLNIGAFLLCLTFYIRYKQVADFYVSHEKQQLLKRLNTVSLVLGLLGSLGVSIVGNFQETSVVVAHFIGASLCFGLGTIYLWIQVGISYYLKPNGWPRLLLNTRILMAMVNTSCLLLTIIASMVATLQAAEQGEEDSSFYQHWGTGSAGWSFHLVATVSEWVMAAAFDIFILTLARDFQGMVMESHCYNKMNKQEENTLSVNAEKEICSN